jgi:hypothetical protein
MHEASRIEQDVDLANVLGHRGNGCAVAHVEPGDLGSAFVGEQSKFLLVNVGCKDRSAFVRKGQRASAADTHRRCRHECALALQAL